MKMAASSPHVIARRLANETPMRRRRSDYIIADDGPGTPAYRVPCTGLVAHDRRRPDGRDGGLAGRDRREHTRRAR
jgi:hypothetical protein